MRRSPAAPGAGPDFDGASAVQTHMTNSRLTDPEILETRFPVLLERFAIRRGSGGAGAHQGGDGVVAPHPLPRADDAPASSPTAGACRRAGSSGGGDAQPGVNKVVRADGSEEMLTATASAEMAAGDAVRDRDAGRRGLRARNGHEQLLPLLGILLVVTGLRAAVQSDAGGAGRGADHRLLAGLDLVEVISKLGKAFNDNRIIIIPWWCCR